MILTVVIGVILSSAFSAILVYAQELLPGRVFLDRYAELIDLSASGQLAMRKVFEDHLQRVEWDQWKFPVRLYPYVGASQAPGERPIAIAICLIDCPSRRRS